MRARGNESRRAELGDIGHAYRRTRTVRLDTLRAFADGPGPRDPERGRVHHAERRRIALHEPDHHDELWVSFDELVGPVDRIDEKHLTRRREVGERFWLALLGDDRYSWEFLRQAFHDERVGAPVGFGHRIGRTLEVHDERRRVHLRDERCRFGRDADEYLERAVVQGRTPMFRMRNSSVSTCSCDRYGGSLPASRTSSTSCWVRRGPMTAHEMRGFEST